MQNILRILFFAIFCANFSGCAVTKKDSCILRDAVFVYELPYDLTYLRTLDALNLQKGWVLWGTEKEKGIISVQNTEYTHLDDADMRKLTFLVKRVDREHTSLSLAPESQCVQTSGDVLDAVDQRIRAGI
jgi:anthranilate phosphoribosyltransferase